MQKSNDIYLPLANKYYKWYCNIIHMAQLRNNGEENHHIIPKSLGGNYRKNNLVSLTSKEHLICHWLLIYCYEGKAKAKMVYALNRMCNRDKNSRLYDIARKLHTQNISGENNPRFGGNGCLGYKHTVEHRKHISERMTGEKHSMYGKKHKEESKQKTSSTLTANTEWRMKTVERSSRQWNFIDPDHQCVTIFNLTEFCKNNNLSYGNMTQVYYGYYQNYKGWSKA